MLGFVTAYGHINQHLTPTPAPHKKKTLLSLSYKTNLFLAMVVSLYVCVIKMSYKTKLDACLLQCTFISRHDQSSPTRTKENNYTECICHFSGKIATFILFYFFFHLWYSPLFLMFNIILASDSYILMATAKSWIKMIPAYFCHK